jgi:hypothetical protein
MAGRAGDAVAKNLQESAEEDGEARGSGDADALGEDVEAATLDAAEQVVVDGDEDPEGGAGVGVDQREELVTGFVTVLGTIGEAFEDFALVEGEVGAVAKGSEVFDANAIAVQVVEREIDAAAFRIFADVAEDIGELEGEAGFFGELLGAWVGVAEDANADEADD